MGDELRVRRGRRREPTGGSSRRRWSRAAAGSRDGARVGGRAVLEHGVTVGEGTTIEGAVVMQGAEIGAHCTLRGCIVAARRAIGDHCVIDGMSVLGEGVDARRRQRRLQRRAALPGRRRCPTGRCCSDERRSDSTRAIAAVDSHRPARRRCSACRSTCATRCGASSPPARGRSTRPGGADRRRHGRLGGRRAARARRARRAAARPLVVADGYALPGWAGPETLVLCSSYSGNTEETLSAYDDAVERGAPRLVATTGGALAERARRDGVPVIPLPGGFQPRAAVGYSLVSRAGGGGARRAPRRRCATRSRRRRRWPPTLAAEWGPDGARGLRGEGDRARAARHGAGDRRRRARGRRGATAGSASSTRTPSCRRSRRCCPEADHNEVVGWDAARELGPVLLRLARGPGRAPAQRAARGADRGASPRPAPTPWCA